MGSQLANPFGEEPEAPQPDASSQLANPFGEAPQANSAAPKQADSVFNHLGSYADATNYGVRSIGQGVVSAVKGMADMVAPPKTTGEKIAGFVGGAPGLLVQRTAKQLLETGSQATQVPGAIRDINKSADPVGTYADVAQKTAAQGAGQALTAAATEGVVKGVAKAGDVLASGVDKAAGTKARIAYPKETAGLPNDAIRGSNDLVTAAAPTGTKVNFRGNTYGAAWDMQQVAKSVGEKLKQVKAGDLTPDYRVKVTVDGLDEHLKNMYKTEVEPQIQSAPQQPTKLSLSPQAKAGLQYVAETAGDPAVQALAKKALEEGTIPLSEANELAQQVNTQLRDFNKLRPSDKYALKATNKSVNGLEHADKALAAAREQTLKSIGQPGLASFEKRYAYVSQYRDQLARRISQTELQQEGVVGMIGKVGKTVRQATGGAVDKAMAGASQSSVANVKAGHVLQRGLEKLSKSSIPDPRPRGTGSGVRLPNQAAPGGFQLRSNGQLPAAGQDALEYGGAMQDEYGRDANFPQKDAPLLGLSGGEAPQPAQRPLSFMDKPNPKRSGPVYPGGK